MSVGITPPRRDSDLFSFFCFCSGDALFLRHLSTWWSSEHCVCVCVALYAVMSKGMQGYLLTARLMPNVRSRVGWPLSFFFFLVVCFGSEGPVHAGVWTVLQ